METQHVRAGWMQQHKKNENNIVELNKESMKVDLHMDFKKTQVMINKYTQNGDIVIKIEKEVIDHVNNCVYLGQ